MSATVCGFCGKAFPGPWHDTTACHEHWIARAEKAEADLAELRAAVRTYLDASRASWTGGPATAAAYEAELRLATLVSTSAPPAGSK